MKLPSNADKRRSGTHAQLRREAERMERAVQTMLQAHRARDEAKDSDAERAVEQVRIDKMRAEARRIREFLAAHEERRSEKGAVRKSNVTDNDSAKMATAKGVIQGYAAIAAVDSKAQIIVAAQAHGSGSEQSALVPMIDTTSRLRSDQTIITADAGYHSEANLRELYERNVPALIADNLMRRRNERFKAQEKYKQLPDPLWDKTGSPKQSKFTPRTSATTRRPMAAFAPRESGSIRPAATARPTAECTTSSRVPSATACLVRYAPNACAIPSVPRPGRSPSSPRARPLRCRSPSA